MLTAQKTRQKIQDKVNLLAKHPYIGIIDSNFLLYLTTLLSVI